MAISRKSNARIARELVRIAKSIVAEENEFNGYELLDKHDCKQWGHTACNCHIYIGKLYRQNIELFDDPDHTYGIVYSLHSQNDRMDEALYEMKKEYNHYKAQSEACTDLVKLNDLNQYAFVYQSSKDIPEIMPGAYWK